MHQKTNQVHIGDHFCSSLTMQDHLQRVDAEYYTPKCDTITGGTVSVYLSVYVMNRRGERTQPCRCPTLTLKGLLFMPLTRTQTSDCLYNNLIAANS